MNIKHIFALDLFSYECLDLSLDNLGLVSVEGINHDDGGSNGSGKTSIYKVLCWTLYGDPLTKVRADDVIRLDTETREPVVGRTMGHVTLEVDGKVVDIQRGRKHEELGNKIRLSINGNDHTASTDKETQKAIDQLLQMDGTSFTNVVLFQQNAKGFASATDAEQKAVFEKVLCLERFTAALERKKSAVKDLLAEKDTLDVKMEEVKKQIDQSLDRLENLKTNDSNFHEHKEKTVNLYEAKIADHLTKEPHVDQTLLENKAKLESQKSERTRIEGIVSKANKLVSEAQGRYSATLGQIAALKQTIKDIPQEPVKPEFDSNHYQRVVTQAMQSLGNAESSLAQAVMALTRTQDQIAAKQAMQCCGTCGQNLTEAAKIKLFGDLESNIPILETAIQAHKGSKESHTLAVESTKRVLHEALEWEKWHKFAESANKAKTAIETLETASADYAKEAQRLEGVRQKAQEALRSIADVQDELRQVEQVIAQQAIAVKLWETDRVAMERDLQRTRDETSPYLQLIDREKQHKDSLVGQYQEAHKSYAEVSEKTAYEEFWIQGFSRSGVVSMLLDEVVPELNLRANEYLDVLTGGKAWVEFSTKTTLASGEQREKFSITVNYDNGAGLYGAVSGGEMRRVDIAILLALGDVAASRAHAPVRLRLLDEPFDNLDAVGKERVVQLLQEKIVPNVGTLLVMSHDEELKAMFDKRIVVEKKNGVSSIREMEIAA